MTNYLVEIGVEELPYKFIPSAEKQLQEGFEKSLSENRIEYKNIKVYGTPRRLAVIIEDISETQPDLAKKIKGPPAKIAYDEAGNLTKAAEGFCKKQNINTDCTYKAEVEGVEYLFADIKEEGKKTAEVLQKIVPEIFLGLQGTRFMRWGNFDSKFSRPVRWIVSLLDKDEVKLKIENIESTKFSRGHRFHTEQNVEITSANTYLDDLYNAKVIVSTEKRKEEIIKAAKEIVKSVDGEVNLDPDLVEEVSYITEWPVPVLGSFESKYLSIPKDVIVTVMATHQRYFPVFKKGTKELLNYFITMGNYVGTEFDNIKRGNERVIKARLDDAIFFYTEDTKKTLADRVDDLKGVTFQKGLGTVYDKTLRLEQLSEHICKTLNLDAETMQKVKRTAYLCKADLVTSLVFEFTELQGFIGSDYARVNGEDELVSIGIKEHYMPVSAEDDLAEHVTGQIVGIADKIDTICAVFALGKAPTGSADPLGLRRASLGVIRTLLNQNININISDVIEKSISLLPLEIADKNALINEIKDFIVQRLRIHLNEQYRYDVVEAALAVNDSLADLKDLLERIKVLTGLVAKSDYNLFHESANRIYRIMKEDSVVTEPNESLFVEEEEKQLWNNVKTINIDDCYGELARKLEALIPFIQKFFDKVLVMDKDESIKANRLALLTNIKLKFNRIADFSKIVA